MYKRQVIGGVIFAVATCICYVTGIAEFVFDDILKEVFMVFFFTSVGFQADLKVLKSGGKSMIVFLGLVIGLIVLQNGTAVGLAKLLHLDPLVGMCTGSIPMTGGHGTACLLYTSLFYNERSGLSAAWRQNWQSGGDNRQCIKDQADDRICQ